MAKPIVNCERIGLDFAQSAPISVTVIQEIAVSPERLWAILMDAESWPKWVLPIQHVEWTSAPPIAVGTTRTVTMVGGMVGYEEYLAYEPHSRFAFRFNETVKGGPDAFLEDYHLRDLGGDRTELSWTMAMRIDGATARFAPVISAGMKKANASFLKKLASYAASNPSLEPDRTGV